MPARKPLVRSNHLEEAMTLLIRNQAAFVEQIARSDQERLELKDWQFKTEDWQRRTEAWQRKTEDWQRKTEDWQRKAEERFDRIEQRLAKSRKPLLVCPR